MIKKEELIFFSQNPFVKLTIALIIGILLAYFVPSQLPFLILFEIGFLGALIIHIFQKHLQNSWINLGNFLILSCLFSLGGLLTQNIKTSLNQDFTNQKSFYGVVNDMPTEKPKTYLIPIKLIQENLTLPTQIIGYFSKNESSKQLEIGDTILIKTTLSKPQYLNNPNTFDYADYLYKKRFYTTSYITQNQWILIGKNQSFQIKKWSNNIRNHLLNIYKKYGLTNDTFAIASAISLGYKDELSEEIKEQFSQSGASHILAVSGLHVGIIFLVISKILYPFNRNKHLRLLKLIIILLLLWGYALITGLSASVVRSTIMFSIIALGTTLKRNSNIYNSISIAAFFMLIYNPFYLLDISFQLSFSAVIGIVFIEKKIENLLTPKNKLGQACWTLICVSIASQLATLPFTIYYFHQFPNYFILTNLFVIFLTTFIVYTAITLLIISPITNLASIFGLLFKYEIRLLNFIVKFISDLPHSHTKNLWINPLETLMLALFIYCFIFFVFYKKNRHFHYALMCLIIYFISRNIQLYHQLHHPQIIVYSNKNEPCIQFINQNTSLTFYQNEISKRNSSLNTISRHKLNNKFVLTNNQCILLNGKYNVIANQNLNFSIPENWSKKPINLLIINKINAEEFKKYLNFLVPNKVIINHGISKKQNDKIKQICRSQNIDYHSIEENGAFIAYE